MLGVRENGTGGVVRISGIAVGPAGVNAQKVVGGKAYRLTNPKLDDDELLRLLGFLDDNAITYPGDRHQLLAEFHRRGLKTS